MVEPKHDFGDYRLGDASFYQEGVYVALSRYNNETAEYERESHIAVLDWQLNLIREFTYKPTNDDYARRGELFAVPTGGFWTVEIFIEVAGLDDHDMYLRGFDSLGNPVISVSDKDLPGEGITDLRILAVDNLGRVFVSVSRSERFDPAAIRNDDIVLVDQTGAVVSSWQNMFTSQLEMTVLDDGTPVVTECIDTFSGANAGNIYELTGNGEMELIGNIRSATGDINEVANSNLVSTKVFAGVGRTVYLAPSDYRLYRLSLDTMEGVAVADYHGIEDPYITAPLEVTGTSYNIYVNNLTITESGSLMCQTTSRAFVVFEK